MKRKLIVPVVFFALLASASAKEATSSFYIDVNQIQGDDLSDFIADDNSDLLSTNLNTLEAKVVGRGFDTVVGEAKQSRCVYLEKSVTPLGESSEKPFTHYFLTKIDDESSFRNETELTASAALNWANGKADASAKYLSDGKFTSFKSYVLVGVDINYPEQSQDYEKFHLTKYAKALLSKGGVQLFRFHCGDAFVVGFNSGAKFGAMINVDSTTSTEHSEDKKAVDAAYKQGLTDGNIDVATKSFFERKQASGQLHIDVVRTGLEEDLPSFDVNALQAYVLTFPTKIRDLAQKPIRKVVTAPYTTLLIHEGLESIGESPPWVSKLSSAFIYLTALERYKADLQYIRDNKGEFVPFDERPLGTRIEQVNASSAVITWAAECSRTRGVKCVELQPPRIGIPVFSALRANPWLDPRKELYPKISTPQPVGETPPTADMVLESRGRWRYGPDPTQVAPITFSTKIEIINKATGQVEWRPTQITMQIPANSSVFFQFIQKKCCWGYNDVDAQAPGSVRLGGGIDNFIKDTSAVTLE